MSTVLLSSFLWRCPIVCQKPKKSGQIASGDLLPPGGAATSNSWRPLRGLYIFIFVRVREQARSRSLNENAPDKVRGRSCLCAG
jgi:hypothetical protein